MALLCYLWENKDAFGIKVSALNCDHAIRPASADDSAFVIKYCEKLGIKCHSYKYDKAKGELNEERARAWRLRCYFDAVQKSAEEGPFGKIDYIATAHHLEDNAETLLFNIARGSGMKGASGIHDGPVAVFENADDGKRQKIGSVYLIRPLLKTTRKEIDDYIEENGIPFVQDETNFSDEYTRNKIRHNVLPALEDVVPGAMRSMLRFSEIVRETEEDLQREGEKLIENVPGGYSILRCESLPIFSRAVLSVFENFGLKDYTRQHVETLFNLQFKGAGKKFVFLGLLARSENGCISLCVAGERDFEETPIMLATKRQSYYNEMCVIRPDGNVFLGVAKVRGASGDIPSAHEKVLFFDMDAVPRGAVIRFMREGDTFTKFGGGTKNLSKYFTDLKIPLRVRKCVPLVASGSDILVVGGVEISEKVKITPQTSNPYSITCCDYRKL
ncbi:MAG: tRNA lysidine(34) synthetase TilS [Clostridia bacterium]|nr:tRNA lysidine(34) synthetase TilS [Clostridia bacterium]